MCILFAATYPERTRRFDHAGLLRAADVGAGLPVGAEAEADHEAFIEEVARELGRARRPR